MMSSILAPLSLILSLFTLFLTPTHAATFVVVNQCTYTVWAAASPGGIGCSDDINGQCLEELKAPGGCNNPCIYYCNNKSESYGSTTYSQFFKDKCLDAYTYPLDLLATFTCPSGTNYEVTSCPRGPKFYGLTLHYFINSIGNDLYE
ncbi:hypothetical protein EUGRSUZ_D01891 [Eucalyptus grandis]|uniref:Uncharacterized protein n=2 Tax=Eucalyptus grandis TaxID=71139 RepID=A0ACC3L786_EUCGR|nr:hypothetical protein EUGRSUZ_D01891 [Eucalyptus grandis]